MDWTFAESVMQMTRNKVTIMQNTFEAEISGQE